MRRNPDSGRDLVIYLPLVAMLMSVLVYVGVFATDEVLGKIAVVVAILGIGLAFSTAVLRQRRRR
ncbi:MAG TPA: hypothetical protein VGW11_09665 [Solirubrobacteraceae bacterium]|nr:hypothetical protein [Solirubrobacteraceae bacterium]